MRWHGIRLDIVILALLIALGSFLGVQWLYGSLNFQKPLEQKLARHEFVTHYEIKQNNTAYHIIVTPATTTNLMQSYQQLNQDVQLVMGRKNFTLELDNQPHDLLDDVVNRGDFAIYEAIAIGNFTAMQHQLNDIAGAAGVNSRVFIDRQNIYWQLSIDQSFVYRVIARPDHGDVNWVSMAQGR